MHIDVYFCLKGSQESTDSGPGKDYVLYADSDGDMNTWIKVTVYTIQCTCICYAQSTDLDHPRMVSREPLIRALRRQSEDYHHSSFAQAQSSTNEILFRPYASEMARQEAFDKYVQETFMNGKAGSKTITRAKGERIIAYLLGGSNRARQ